MRRVRIPTAAAMLSLITPQRHRGSECSRSPTPATARARFERQRLHELCRRYPAITFRQHNGVACRRQRRRLREMSRLQRCRTGPRMSNQGVRQETCCRSRARRHRFPIRQISDGKHATAPSTRASNAPTSREHANKKRNICHADAIKACKHVVKYTVNAHTTAHSRQTPAPTPV